MDIHLHPIYEAQNCGTAHPCSTNEKHVTCPECRERMGQAQALTVTFPRLRFVADNALCTQIKKIEEELKEVQGAFLLPGYDLLADELLDLMQAAATGLMILGEHRGVDVPAVVARGREKNRARGYEHE